MKTGKRYSWIDILYAIGITLVILGHSHPSDWVVFGGTVFEKVIIFIYIFHMPLFFYIAGFLFMNSESIKKIGYKKWIKEKSMKLLVPYVVLSLLALIPKYYLEHGVFITFRGLAEAICIPRIGVWGHFWFIPVLLLCYVIFGLLRNKLDNIVWLSSITILSLLVYFIPLSTQWFGISDLKSVCIYFCLGMWNKYIDFEWKRKSLFVEWMKFLFMVGAACFIFANVTNRRLVISILMIAACCQMAKIIENSKIASYISQNNFTIYIYSWIFQSTMMMICGKLEMAWQFTSIFMFIAGFVGPICIVLIYRKWGVIHNRFFALILGIK